MMRSGHIDTTGTFPSPQTHKECPPQLQILNLEKKSQF